MPTAAAASPNAWRLPAESAMSTLSPAKEIGASDRARQSDRPQHLARRGIERERVPVEAAGNEHEVVDDQRRVTSGLARRRARSTSAAREARSPGRP